MNEYITGFTVALGLIVAIGAQNAWVLGMSIKRLHPWPIAIVCFTIDAVLMALGIVFLSQLQIWLPALIPWLTYIGIGLLSWLCVQSISRVIKGSGALDASSNETNLTISQAVFLAVGISLLNPHVYLDTVVLIGSIAVNQSQPWVFWVGSASASVLWFSSLAAAGRPLSRWLSSVNRWRAFDSLIALIMAVVAFSLYQNL